MTTVEYLPVRQSMTYSDACGPAWYYSVFGETFRDRQKAVRWGTEELGHDDFLTATLVDGRLAAIGGEVYDLDPIEEDLPEIAARLGLEMATVHWVSVVEVSPGRFRGRCLCKYRSSGHACSSDARNAGESHVRAKRRAAA